MKFYNVMREMLVCCRCDWVCDREWGTVLLPSVVLDQKPACSIQWSQPQLGRAISTQRCSADVVAE
jgi:hypothetical protein